MRKSYIFELLIVSLAFAVSCDRNETPLEEPCNLIQIAASGEDVQTRGLLNMADLPTVDTKVKIYDYLTGFTGKIGEKSYTDGNVMYIEDEVKCVTAGNTAAPKGSWEFVTAPWRWTRTGTHHFFGWLEKDALSGLEVSSLFTPPTLDADNTINVPSITFNKDTKQFDFSYSDVVTVSTIPDDGTVELPLKHLFSAFALTITNDSPDNAYIKEITLTGFNNKRSATVTFDTERGATAVNYGTGSYESFLPNWPSEATEDANYGRIVAKATSSSSGTVPTRYDLVNGKKLAADDANNYILMWPQLASEFVDATITVKYYIDGVKDTENETNPDALLLHERSFLIKDVTGLMSMDAGVKYALNLEFKDKTINLTLIPIPWQMVYEDLDYSSSTILANSNKENDGVLWLYYLDGSIWQAGSRDRLITMQDNKDIQGRFYILAPTSGQWQITTYPAEAAQYFTVEPSSGAIEDLVDRDGNFLGYVEFYVKAKGVVPATQTVHFNVDIMLNGQWRNANTEFNRKDWQLTREP